ncbi:MAG: hypothetical protein ACSLFH_02700 [Desulfuromonadales bacterium]
MQHVAIGDVIFVILVLGIIHGIMYFATLARRRKTKIADDPGNSKK